MKGMTTRVLIGAVAGFVTGLVITAFVALATIGIAMSSETSKRVPGVITVDYSSDTVSATSSEAVVVPTLIATGLGAVAGLATARRRRVVIGS